MKNAYSKNTSSKYAITALILSLGMSLSVAVQGLANELDNERSIINADREAAAKDLPSGLILRIAEGSDGKETLEVLHLNENLESLDEQFLAGVDSQFTPIAINRRYSQNTFTGRDELNQDEAQESWFFWVGFGVVAGVYTWNYHNPRYFYRGYQYSYWPRGHYTWGGGYRYIHYRNCYRYRHWC